VKFYIIYSNEHLLRNSKFGQNRTRIWSTLQDGIIVFHAVGSSKCSKIYWEGLTVFPCQRFQFLLHCWQWRV